MTEIAAIDWYGRWETSVFFFLKILLYFYKTDFKRVGKTLLYFYKIDFKRVGSNLDNTIPRCMRNYRMIIYAADRKRFLILSVDTIIDVWFCYL